MPTNQEKLDDLHWILCTDDGRNYLAELTGSHAADKTLNTPIKRQGAMGGFTSLASLVAWDDDKFIRNAAAINARPAGTAAAVDVDALVARLKAEVPPAVLAAIVAKLK
jgi:hypothetical protein